MPRHCSRARSVFAAFCAFFPVALLGATAPAASAQPGSTDAQMRAIDPKASVDSTNRTPTAADYKALQDRAPEVLLLSISTVKTQPATVADVPEAAGGALAVASRAVVLGVIRTATNRKVGDVITLYYGYVPLKPGADGQPPTPIVQEGVNYRAYLTGGGGDNPYRAAAGAQSFLNSNAGENSPVGGKATGPVADPTLLPTPNNPKPPGSLRLTGSGMESFVKLAQVGGKWTVSIVNSDPIPLQVIGDAPPVLLYYYGKPAAAPYTQPLLVIYRAGTQPPTPPATRVLTIERALILDNDRHLLADVLWAPRGPDDGQPPPLLPVWTWFSYKLEIADAETQKVQTILLSGQPPPAAGPVPGASGARR